MCLIYFCEMFSIKSYEVNQIVKLRWSCLVSWGQPIFLLGMWYMTWCQVYPFLLIKMYSNSVYCRLLDNSSIMMKLRLRRGKMVTNLIRFITIVSLLCVSSHYRYQTIENCGLHLLNLLVENLCFQIRWNKSFLIL